MDKTDICCIIAMGLVILTLIILFIMYLCKDKFSNVGKERHGGHHRKSTKGIYKTYFRPYSNYNYGNPRFQITPEEPFYGNYYGDYYPNSSKFSKIIKKEYVGNGCKVITILSCE